MLKQGKQLMLMNITVEDLVPQNHSYRRIKEIVNFKNLYKKFESLYSQNGAPGIPIEQGFSALILQFMEDLSDRQMEKALQENNAFKWFCGFDLQESTPDHTYFCKLRKRLGTQNIAKAFNYVVKSLEEKGLMGNCFTFVDATSVISKTALWEESDKAIKKGEAQLNNKNVNKFSSDKNARYGCKGKNKFWYGYKRHQSVDMKSGLIKKVCVTPANVSDSKAAKHVLPKEGMVFMDKGYATKEVEINLKKKGCHSGVILKNNMKGKDFRRDAWLSKIRMPFEGVFSKVNKRARYRSTVKNQLHAFMEGIQYNLKRASKILETQCSLG